MKNYLKGIVKAVLPLAPQKKYSDNTERISRYLQNGRQPWSVGYLDYRQQQISALLPLLTEKPLSGFPESYGLGLDERLPEYTWLLCKLPSKPCSILDAGSTFNFDYILSQKKLENKDLSIYTFYPENNCFFQKRISYNFGDLRNMPYRDNWFDFVVCQSTLEHIDMDNSIYGYKDENPRDYSQKSFEYLKAVSEFLRVLKSGGTLLITVPFGKFESHGFFQQFDHQMKAEITNLLQSHGVVKENFFKYTPGGWIFSKEADCADAESFNPHTGKGKGEDGAAHSRAIFALEFVKH